MDPLAPAVEQVERSSQDATEKDGVEPLEKLVQSGEVWHLVKL